MKRENRMSAEQYLLSRRRKKAWQKIVIALACVVVFCTTYALILPAITQENAVSCGMEVHEHTEECYTQLPETEVLQQICATEVHVHTESCLNETGDVICGQADYIAHTHGELCWGEAGNLICTLEEQSAHSHREACWQTVETLIPSVIHSHTDDCLDETEALTCGYEEGAVISEETVATEEIMICTEPVAQTHVHVAECFQTVVPEAGLTCTLEENDTHTHGDMCYGTWELSCGIAEHTHTLSCYADPAADVETAEDWEKSFADAELTGVWAEDLIVIAQTQLGYQESTRNYIVLEDGVSTKGYTRYGAWYGDPYGDWCAMFVSFCLDYAGVEEMPLDSGCPNWIAKLTEAGLYQPQGTYVPESGNLIFFDWDADSSSDHVGIVTRVAADEESGVLQISTIEGNSGNRVQSKSYAMDDATILGFGLLPVQLTGEERIQVESVIAMIDAMPSADEIDARIEEFEEAEDYEGEEAWLTETYQQVARAYYCYDRLTDDQKTKITNADKLLELEYIWSVTTLKVTETVDVYMVNSYSTSHYDDNVTHTGTVLFNGGSATDYGYSNSVGGFAYWSAIIVEESENGTLYVSNIYKNSGPGQSKSSYAPSTSGGFVLLVWESTITPGSLDVAVGDIVSAPFDRTQTGTYTATSYGTITFSDSVTSSTADVSQAPTMVESAKTKDFIELNLYDYNGSVNTNYNSDKDWPGFQWNGGAYVPGATNANTSAKTYNRRLIDFIDFGNSIITDNTYGGNKYSFSANSISKNRWNIGNQGGNINAIVEYPEDDYANKPVGISNGTEVLGRNLSEAGYPWVTNAGSMVDYFSNSSFSTKQNTESIDGLFQINDTTGGYFYNSRWNHAQYGNNKFTLYEEIITPNFITYPFGNFLPLNSITDLTSATQVSAFNYSGGMANYVNKISNGLSSSNATESQLLSMLNKYKENWKSVSYDNNGTAVNWTNLSPANAIRDYFTISTGNNPSDDVSFITEAHLDNMYNIDWDVATNFFFGMEMKMKFMQPKDGLTGKDNGDNAKGTWFVNANGDDELSGESDGIPDYPMHFYFTGDDDVWVYIDGVLFLDLSGIHRHVGGEIDFVNGKVHYYALEPATGDVSTTPYATYTFAQLLTAAGKSTEGVLNSNGTFIDYTTHEFKFYYMERGSGSSVCRLNFNFPLLRQNAITVQKELSINSDVDALGNPSYPFQVMKANSDETKTETLFIAAGTAYTLYDVDGSIIQEVKLTKNPDGTIASRTVVDANGTPIADANVLKTNENGVFYLKAGQKAEFVGIDENEGKYYVRELLNEVTLPQYGQITVSGDSTTKVNDVVVGGETFTGADSPVTDMSDGATLFRFTNQIDTAKLSNLSISKTLTEFTPTRSVKYYDVEVTLDGVKLPVGTAYTVGMDTRYVEAEGIITIAADETATISQILAGSAFTVQETSGSAEGYVVTYLYEGGESVSIKDGKVTGLLKADADVQISINNSEKGTTVTIPGTKSLSKYDGAEYTYTFRLDEVTDATGATLKEGGIQNYTATATVKDAAAAFRFSISYVQVDVGTLPQTFYYKIVELDSANTITDDTVYVAEVKVEADDSGGIKATLVAVHGSESNSADFVNTLTGDLSLEKMVVGSTEAQTNEQFDFTITLDSGDSGVALKDRYPATVTQANGEIVETSFKVTNGVISINEVHHGESVVIHDLPIGTKWTIEETAADGYSVITTVSVNGAEPDAGTGTSVSGSIAAGSTAVTYTNSQMYELPETGGAGVTLYTMAGLMLMLCSMAYLLYRYQKRGKEVQ